MGMFDFAGDLLGIGQAVSGIAGMFGRRKENQGEEASSEALTRSMALSAALSDPNNAQRMGIANTKLQQQRDARLRGIQDFIQAETRAARRNPNGPTFIARNPRRDEAVARAFMTAGQNEWADADDAAKADLATALSGQLQSGGFAQRQIPFQWEGQQRRDSVLPGVFGAGRDLAGALGRSWGGMSSPVSADINNYRGGYGGDYGPRGGDAWGDGGQSMLEWR